MVNWAEHLERLARVIPGIGRYQDREGLRETDKLVRTHLAARLGEMKLLLEEGQRRLAEGKHLDRLPAVDRIVRRLGTLADRLRYASYGFAAVFDLQKVREPELASLHRFDLALADAIPPLRERVGALAGAEESGFSEALRAAEAAVQDFEDMLNQRDSAARHL